MRAVLLYSVIVILTILLDIKLVLIYQYVALIHWYLLYYGVFVQGIAFLWNWSFYELKKRFDRYMRHRSQIFEILKKLSDPSKRRSNDETRGRNLERVRRRIKDSSFNLACFVAVEVTVFILICYGMPYIKVNLA